ncbi:MAG: 4Fe-4S dicluster domain-containing protein [Sphingomonadaceae bacterium]
MSQPREIFVRPDRCQGCHTCELACAVEHSRGKSLFVALGEHPRPVSRVWVEWVAPRHKVPVVCRHCEDAPCMHACISGAIRRTADGVVLTETDKCIGCWTCVMVCPYGVIGRHLETRKSYRCDRCPDREEPACVSACPTGALVYRTVPGFSAEARQAAAAGVVAGERG